MSAITIFLGRLIGLYLTAIVVNRNAHDGDARRNGAQRAWMLFSGLVATAAGLAVVLGHQVWTGGALPVVVTLAGCGPPS